MTTTERLAGLPPVGFVEIQCAMCDWTQPTGRFTDHGTPERPGCADYCDAVMPSISEHIDGTGHPVRVTLTTLWPDREDEQSTWRFLPRTTTTERTTTP